MGKDKAEKKLKKQAKAKPINVKAVNPEIFDGDRIAEGKKSRFARVKVTEKKTAWKKKY
ncbi:hypothetical protein NPX79_01655 [Spiroplasma endosymbiont of Anurida maritima]|uniref:hypothetical protein n=1 Tax=Spiroplasma endosymbiont of Anurida maritima TaxID=2967972 RepID=UPI0036D262E1